MSDRKTVTIERLKGHAETWGHFFGDEGTINNVKGASIDYGAFSTWHENIIYAVYVDDLNEETIERAIHRIYGFRLAVREKYANDKKTTEGGIDGWFYPVLFGDFEATEYDLWWLQKRGVEYWRITGDYRESVENIKDAKA